MPHNPTEPRDSHGRWTSGGETATDRYARSFYPDHPTDSEIRIRRAAGEAPPKPGRDLTPEEGREVVGKANGWEGTPYAPPGTPYPGPNAKRGPDGGADCSGSVNKIYGEAGHPFPYTPSGNFPNAARSGKIPFRELGPNERPQPGDVVVYPGHMSIYTGNGGVYSAHRAGGAAFSQSRESDFGTPIGRFRYQDRGRSI